MSQGGIDVDDVSVAPSDQRHPVDLEPVEERQTVGSHEVVAIRLLVAGRAPVPAPIRGMILHPMPAKRKRQESRPCRLQITETVQIA